jgi:uncharacterized protein (TIGR04222 family)
MSGPDFLLLYIAMLPTAMAAGWLLVSWLRPAGREGDPSALIGNRKQHLRGDDPELLAHLVGGGQQVATSVVAGLVGKGHLRVDHGLLERAEPIPSPTHLQQWVWQQTPCAFPALAVLDAEDERGLDAGLIQQGLAMTPSQQRQLRLLRLAPFVVPLGWAASRILSGLSNDHPVSYLVVLVLFTMMFLPTIGHSDRLTRAGKALLRQRSIAHARLRRAQTADEAQLTVALFGVAVLAGSSTAAALKGVEGFSGSDGGGSGGSDSGGGGDSGGSDSGGCGGGD